MKKYEYHQIYKPDSSMSYKNGFISEHRYMASLKLGRDLRPEECVHHIDGNKNNNSIENLMVFRSNSDHVAFHKGANALLDGDVYYCPKDFRSAERNKYNICPMCGGLKSGRKAKICVDCYKKQQESKIPCCKEQLSELILNNTMVDIGDMFNVSNNAVKKWCKKYSLPYKYNDIKEYRQKMCS